MILLAEMPCEPHVHDRASPAQLATDPIEAARRLAPAIEAAMELEPDRLYAFKREFTRHFERLVLFIPTRDRIPVSSGVLCVIERGLKEL